MTEVSCNIIKDLLPLYVEGLTSEDTNKLIEEHLAGCEDCRKLLADMTGGEGNPDEPGEAPTPEEKEAIDFMKKSNRKLKRGVVFTVIAIFALFLCLVLARGFFRAYDVSADTVMVTYLDVTEHEATVRGCLSDSARGFRAKQVSFDDGVLSISLKSSLVSFLTDNDFLVNFTTTEEIKCVKVAGEVVWDRGTEVSRDSAKLFAAKHRYIGDMSANAKSIHALDISEKLGPFENELQTSVEPYGWIIHLQNDMSDRNLEKLNDQLAYYSAMLIATIDNLGYVQFDYSMCGEDQMSAFSEEYVDWLYGSSVKEAAGTASGLYEMMNNW